MNRKIVCFLVTSFLLLAPHAASAEVISISVKGMVCSFCAQGIKKTLKAVENVESVQADLDKKVVTVTTKQDTTIEDSRIKQIMLDAGYDVAAIERK